MNRAATFELTLKRHIRVPREKVFDAFVKAEHARQWVCPRGMTMPVAEFDGNSAWLEIGRLAWNLGKWIAQLVLPAEVVRWEWKRYRKAFVHLAAEVTLRSRQCWLRVSPAHRFLATLVAAHAQLQT